jgi:TonB family protein
MTPYRSPREARRVAIAVTFVLALAGSIVSAQDPLGRAKEFYASADYEQALQVLSSMQGKGGDPTEIASYQVFCLVALGRNDEAKKAIETIVRIDPLYHPSEAQASPRVRSFFETVRRPLLPDIVRQTYAGAKDAFDRKQMPVAAKGFDRVITLLEDVKDGDDQGVADLRTLAIGFRDLAKAAPPPPPPPAPTPAAPGPPAAAPAASTTAPAATTPAKPTAPRVLTYGPADKDVRAPVAISQALPPWRPQNSVEARLDYEGSLELLIGEDGSVLSAVIVKSVQPRYDPILLQAAKAWKFQPATKNGQPVRFRLPFTVHLRK